MLGDRAPAPSATQSDAGVAPAVVGLGDSVPAGAQCGCTSFVELVGQSLATRVGAKAPQVHNLAVSGETSAGLLQQLSDRDVDAQVSVADVVLVTIGANDFDPADLPTAACSSDGDCLARERAVVSSTLDSILGKIAQLGPGARVLVTGYWNVFLDGTVGRRQGSVYVRESDALTKAVNAIIEASAARAGDAYVDLYGPFKGEDGTVDPTQLLAADGDHPNAAGHRLIADEVMEVLGEH